MFSTIKVPLVSLGFVALMGAWSAGAAEWSRGTAYGGQLTRSISGDGLAYSGATTRTGPNGGSYTSTSTCLDGVFVNRCHRSYSATGPNGQTYSGDRVTARGPNQVRSIGTVTGPKGKVVIGARRQWR